MRNSNEELKGEISLNFILNGMKNTVENLSYEVFRNKALTDKIRGTQEVEPATSKNTSDDHNSLLLDLCLIEEHFDRLTDMLRSNNDILDRAIGS